MVAFRITEMLRAVVTHGTARKLASLGRPMAGKTGTTNKGVDTWFAGYTPDLVTTVWVGFDDRRTVEKATGGSIAAPIWGRFMTVATEQKAVARFRAPAGVRELPPVRGPVAPPPEPAKAAPEGTPAGAVVNLEELYE